MKRVVKYWLLPVLCVLLCACGNPKTTKSAEDYVGMNYETVMDELSEAGFVNIQVIEVPDLTSGSELQDGDVGKVEIQGDSTFSEGAEFEEGALVTITYHTIKRLQLPISTSEIQEQDSVSIADLFLNTGFTNVVTEEVYDLDPDLYDVEFENEVIVNGQTHFNEGDSVIFDAEIKIICHRTYEKYTVKIAVDFLGNLLFNKYDVVVSLDGTDNTLEHGEDGTFEFRLKEGEYTLQFANVESSSVNGEVSIEVHSDVEASYKIECHKEKITVETLYVDNKEALAEDEVKVLASMSSFAYENYKDVVKTLTEWGFTNIKEVPVYDIIWGITEEGSIDDVLINGTNEFRRGDIFKKDTEVIVSYHLKAEDDPAKQTEAETYDSYVENTTSSADNEVTQTVDDDPVIYGNLTVDNCPELAAILSNKAEYDQTYVDFAYDYKGRTIEFDGRIDYIAIHGNYKTRYDLLVSAGDYDPDHQIGPSFKFNDVNAMDLGLGSLDDIPTELPVGSNVRIIAKVVKFDENAMIFYLDPISVTLR